MDLMPLETRSDNEEMRHIPPVADLIQRLENDFRPQLEMLAAVGTSGDESAAAELDRNLRSVARWLGRIAEPAASHSKQHGGDIGSLLGKSLRAALDRLRKADPALFRRRMPFQQFECSEGERVFEAIAVIGTLIRESIPLAGRLDPTLYERLFPPPELPTLTFR